MTGCRYIKDVASYVNQCPIRLFDTQMNRNISRSELLDNIMDDLGRWMAAPLTCNEIVETMFDALPPYIAENTHNGKIVLRSYIFAAMTRCPLPAENTSFIATTTQQLSAYTYTLARPTMGVMERPLDDDWEGMIREWSRRAPSILQDLIKSKRMRASRPGHEGVRDQIAILGQYTVLSHCWDQDPSEELTFDDIPNLSNLGVNAKRGFSKFMGFAGVVKSHFGCRYLWMDTACISEEDRVASIPLMFGWYRNAYVCVIYLSSSRIPGDRWCARGWTLQEVLAANRIICFTSNWDRVQAEHLPGSRFHACREIDSDSTVYKQLKETVGKYATPKRKISLANSRWIAPVGHANWMTYKPGVAQALNLFYAMRKRETTRPEDTVYSLLSALDVKIPIEYGEGFERAFYRLQVEVLTQGCDRRLLLWKGRMSSPYNSMLCGDFNFSLFRDFYEYRSDIFTTYDPSISFRPDGVMRIMVYLCKPCAPAPPSQVFAVIAQDPWSRGYTGLILEELPEKLYRRIGYKDYWYHEIKVERPPEWIYVK